MLTNPLEQARAGVLEADLTGSNGPIGLATGDDREGFALKISENDEPAYGFDSADVPQMVEFRGGLYAIESRPDRGGRIEVTI